MKEKEQSYGTERVSNQTFRFILYSSTNIGYNKSQKKDFLDKSRTCIRDSSQYVYMKGNFPAIISEEQWNEVQKIKQQKTIKVQKVTNGRRRSKDPWSRKLYNEPIN